MKKALIIVDVQYDFVTGGALEVPGGEKIIPIINRLIPDYDVVVATQDWHPSGHGSFASSHVSHNPGDVINLDGLTQILWPDHCIQATHGASFVKELDQTKIEKVFVKGTEPNIDSYSGFFDNGHRKATGLGDYLKDRGIGQVDIVGLAADYCVKFTALDAVGLGFETTLIANATKGVNLKAGDVDRAIKEMSEQGVKVENR